MTRDLKATIAGIRRAVEEFGSIAHLAEAMNVSQQQLQKWLDGDDEMPLEQYRRMIELIAARKK